MSTNKAIKKIVVGGGLWDNEIMPGKSFNFQEQTRVGASTIIRFLDGGRNIVIDIVIGGLGKRVWWPVGMHTSTRPAPERGAGGTGRGVWYPL